MLAHARLLYQELPAVDETLKAFIAVPSRQAIEETRAMFSLHRAKVVAVEQRFRLLLYLVSLALLIFLVLLGLRLRARAVALRRRAAFEHVIAENSTRLINCSPADMEARLKQVLGEFVAPSAPIAPMWCWTRNRCARICGLRTQRRFRRAGRNRR